MDQPFYRKIDELKDIFSQMSSKKQIYQKILEFGSKLSPFDPKSFLKSHIVVGCQSRVYIKASFRSGLVYFEAASDALISAGLAYILTYVYSENDPKLVVLESPTFLEELKIPHSLSMSRSNGLLNMYKHIQKTTLLEFSSCIK